jgi:hypothetical protein
MQSSRLQFDWEPDAKKTGSLVVSTIVRLELLVRL